MADDLPQDDDDSVYDPPQDPFPEFVAPIIHPGVRNRRVFVIPHGQGAANAKRQSLYLMRAENPERGYEIMEDWEPITLHHHAGNWGEVLRGVVYPRVHRDSGDLYFQEPEDNGAVERVAIKKLNKTVVHQFLQQRLPVQQQQQQAITGWHQIHGCENPYKEIQRMQQFGDDEHVLSCIEALEDNEFLYIIARFCPGRSLCDHIPWRQARFAVPGFPEDRAIEYFRQILKILRYLRDHGVCHHDISPDNLMFLNGHLVLVDFAMSLRIPRNERGQRFRMNPQGRFGTFPFQAPEAFANFPFDGVSTDLWSAAVILFSLVTGEILYELPHPTDIRFRFFIMAEALFRPEANERAAEVLHGVARAGNATLSHDLARLAQVNNNIPDIVMDLLRGLLVLDPSHRWSLEQAWEYLQEI